MSLVCVLSVGVLPNVHYSFSMSIQYVYCQALGSLIFCELLERRLCSDSFLADFLSLSLEVYLLLKNQKQLIGRFDR